MQVAPAVESVASAESGRALGPTRDSAPEPFEPVCKLRPGRVPIPAEAVDRRRDLSPSTVFPLPYGPDLQALSFPAVSC